MKPFSENAQCMKCGWKGVGVQYHDAGGRYASSYDACYRADGEHIDRNCKRCGFAWYEAPLNLLVPTEGPK